MELCGPPQDPPTDSTCTPKSEDFLRLRYKSDCPRCGPDKTPLYSLILMEMLISTAPPQRDQKISNPATNPSQHSSHENLNFFSASNTVAELESHANQPCATSSKMSLPAELNSPQRYICYYHLPHIAMASNVARMKFNF